MRLLASVHKDDSFPKSLARTQPRFRDFFWCPRINTDMRIGSEISVILQTLNRAATNDMAVTQSRSVAPPRGRRQSHDVRRLHVCMQSCCARTRIVMRFVHDQHIALWRITIEERHQSQIDIETEEAIFAFDLPKQIAPRRAPSNRQASTHL